MPNPQSLDCGIEEARELTLGRGGDKHPHVAKVHALWKFKVCKAMAVGPSRCPLMVQWQVPFTKLSKDQDWEAKLREAVEAKSPQ